MRFTTEEAYEASECGEPIMLSPEAVERICRDNDADAGEFYADRDDVNPSGETDAAVLLGWLGY